MKFHDTNTISIACHKGRMYRNGFRRYTSNRQ